MSKIAPRFALVLAVSACSGSSWKACNRNDIDRCTDACTSAGGRVAHFSQGWGPTLDCECTGVPADGGR